MVDVTSAYCGDDFANIESLCGTHDTMQCCANGVSKKPRLSALLKQPFLPGEQWAVLRCRPPPPTRVSSASPIGLTGPSTPPPLLFPLLFALHVGLLLPCHSLHTPSLGFLPKPEPLFRASQPTLLPPSSPGSFVPAPSLPVTVPRFCLHCLPARPRMGRLVRPPGCRAHASAPWSLWPLAMFLSQHGMKPPWSARPQLADRPHTLVPLEVCRIPCTGQAGVGFPVWWWGGGHI